MRKLAAFVLPVVLAAPVHLAAETLPQRALPMTAKALTPATAATSDAPQMQEMVAPEPDILVMRINENGEREVACVHGVAAHRAFMEQGPQQKTRIGNNETTGQE